MEQKPKRDGKDYNRGDHVPRPFEVSGLNREDRDHKVIAEAGMAEESASARIFVTQPADQSNNSDHQNQNRDHDVYGKQRVEVERRGAGGTFGEVLIRPVRAGPQEAETGLNRCAKRGAVRSEFIEQPAKVEWNNTPDQFNVLKWSPNELLKNVPVNVAHADWLTG